MADLKDPQTWQGLGGLYEIFAGVLSAIFAGVWFVGKMNGKINSAHSKVDELREDVEKQRAEDLTNNRREWDLMAGALKEIRDDIKQLLRSGK